jgi:hypothetical protein
MSQLDDAPPAPSEDEFIAEVRRVREELRVVYDAMDELRESVEQVMRGYRQDDWQPTQRRPLVSIPVDLRDPEFATKVNALDPHELPDDLPETVRSAVVARLQVAQRPACTECKPDLQQPDDAEADARATSAGAAQQRALWDADAPKLTIGSAAIAMGAASAEVTPQKEAEPGRGGAVSHAVSVVPQETGEAGTVDHSALAAVEPEQVKTDALPDAPLAGHELVTLMRRHKVTIGELTKRTGITQKRIRMARDNGLTDPNAVRDWVEAIRGRDLGPVGARPMGEAYTLGDWMTFRGRCLDGEIVAAELHNEFGRMKAGKQYFIETLINTKSADQLRLMAIQRGILDARRNSKQENAAALYRGCLSSFTLGDSVSYQPLQESYEEAVERIVLAITDEQIAAERERVRRRKEEKDKALGNPETLLEFATFIRESGLDQLGDDQFARWDALHADRIREDRKSRKQRETVEQFQSAEVGNLEFRIAEGFHDRERIPLWIVQLSTRVERATFQELKIKATQLGGWWSSFKKDAAGFQFRSRESAEKFASLSGGDADRSEELLARKLRKMDSASDRLQAVADSLDATSTEVLEGDESKLKNTARRADMAASMRAQAYADRADAKTLRSIAAALAAGDARYLDGVWNAAQVRTLETILKQARRERIRERLTEEGIVQRSQGWSRRYDELEGQPLSPADARHAVYPKPYLYRGHLVQAFAQFEKTPGLKQITAKMRKMVDATPKEQDFVEFVHEHQIELLEEFLSRAKAAGMRVWWFDHCLDAYKRLRSANIYDAHELRSALRELTPHLVAVAADDPVNRAEDELRGMDLPGFFPTPRPVIDKLLAHARIEPAHRILEPSCGKGDILDAIRRQIPDVTLTAIERNLALQGVLTAKRYGEIVRYEDFLEHVGEYDRVVMNPPFEEGQDILHVRHAYDLLAPAGRLVSIVCEGPFFRNDAKSVAFRAWLEEVAANVEQLPEDAFQGVATFRQTGVRTRLVVVDKPAQ